MTKPLLNKATILQIVLELLRDLADKKIDNLGPESNLKELDQQYGLFESIDFEDFVYGIENRLDVRFSHEEGHELFRSIKSRGVGPALTVAGLVEFLGKKVTTT
ncbi:MAG: hypothetical protein H7062_07485 [Candidatus Saccharimonas sp.]|nr:hypothetical protein [Planctomycetaceae bacterium]